MNLKQINEMRASMGLGPVTVSNSVKAAKAKRTDANRQARAQECRDLKAKRSKGK